MLVGYCDDLATPRPLGPFRDLVGGVGTELSRAVLDGSDRDRVLAALRAELTWSEHPAVLVIEDIHWADDATLDALRYLIRRISGLPAVRSPSMSCWPRRRASACRARSWMPSWRGSGAWICLFRMC